MIVRSVARKVYLSPKEGLVSPAFRKIAKRRIWTDWRLDLKCLIAIIAITFGAGYVNAHASEIWARISKPSSQSEEFVASFKSIAESARHLCGNMDIDNHYTSRAANQ
jgi:hypothetical protein